MSRSQEDPLEALARLNRYRERNRLYMARRRQENSETEKERWELSQAVQQLTQEVEDLRRDAEQRLVELQDMVAVGLEKDLVIAELKASVLKCDEYPCVSTGISVQSVETVPTQAESIDFGQSQYSSFVLTQSDVPTAVRRSTRRKNPLDVTKR